MFAAAWRAGKMSLRQDSYTERILFTFATRAEHRCRRCIPPTHKRDDNDSFKIYKQIVLKNPID
jgi:hypothetical protein